MRLQAFLTAACGIAISISDTSIAQARELTARAIGPRYELKSQGSITEARDLLNVLEAAFPQFEEFFGKAPKASASNRLRVYLYDDQDQWKAGLEQVGGTYLGPAGGNYCWKTQAVFFYRQPTDWFTRKLMLQMCAHQFMAHLTGHKKMASHWYRLGTVNYLSNHAWDGERIQIGVPPALTLENQASIALARLREPDFDYRKLITPTDKDDSAIHCEAMRVIQSEPSYRRALFSLRTQLDKGVALSTEEWNTAFGSYKRFDEKLRDSVARSQEPFVPVINQWETRRVDTDEKTGHRTWTLRGTAPNYISVATTREEANSLEFRVDRKGQPGRVGALLDWIDHDDHTVLLFMTEGSYHVQRRTKQGWTNLAGGAAGVGPAGFTAHSLRIERTTIAEGQVAATGSFDGKALLTTPVRNCRFGFALDSGVYDFEQVRLNR